jgi:hypothetical protein
MNGKRILLAAGAVFVAVQLLEFVLNALFMKAANQQLEGLWRPDMESKIWLMYVFGAFVALLFTFIFVKGREGKGLAEGVRYGLIMWMFVTVPMNVAWWVMLPIPHSVMVRWTLFGLLEMVVAGILVAVIYRPAAPAKPRS